MLLQHFEQPEENVRSIAVGKNVLFMKRTDPHGLIKLNFERGELPKELQGQFTSFEEAAKAVDQYLSKRPKEKEIEEKDGSPQKSNRS